LTKKIRIFKLAKELNIASDELITFLRDSGFEVRNINTPVDEDMYGIVMERFSIEKTMAEKKSELRRKRMIMRGELTDDDGKVSEAKEKAAVKETERPAILDALDTLKKAAKSDKEVAEEAKKAKVKKEPEAAAEEKVPVEKPVKKKKAAKVEKIEEPQAIEEAEVPGEPKAVDVVPEKDVEPAAIKEERKKDGKEVGKPEKETGVLPEEVSVPEEEIKTEVKPEKEKPVEVKEAVVEKEKKKEEPKPVLEELDKKPKRKKRKKTPKKKADQKETLEPIFDEVEVDERELVVGEKIKTIDLSEFDKRKQKKPKDSAEGKPRKLSKKGKGILEKSREKKKKEVGGPDGEKGEQKAKKGKKRKRSRKKKIDVKEIDASIKETMARMEESSRTKKYRKKVKVEEVTEEEIHVLQVPEFTSIAELAAMMDIENSELIKKCLELGMLVTINQRLDMDTIKLLADEFDFEVEEMDVFAEAEISEEEEDDEESLKDRSPVVTIMGHVDHGKTSLLDYIRNANVVAGEKGGITQHIGAYEVEIDGKAITFLDTPGHEAFTAMRARGAQITDIVVLIIAADDNVMPQTLEALSHAQAAGVPIIIAINKIDKPGANPDKIKQQLSERKVLVEEWGGKYPSVEISAKKGAGVQDLLETILIQAEVLELKANPDRRAKGVVIEARQAKGKGTVCTILVQAGTLRVGDHFVCGQFHGRVRATFNERDKKVKSAPPSTPVQVLGFAGMPQAGDLFTVMESDKAAKALSLKRRQLKREHDFRKTSAKSLYDISEMIRTGGIKELLLILKADTDGSLEALEDSFSKLSTEEVEVKVIHKSIGAITEADVLLASASGAIIVGFTVRPNLQARNLAEKEEVEIHLYDVIYDAIADVKAALEGLLEPEITEEITSTVEVREVFKVPKVGSIAGCYVLSGAVVRNSKVRLIRDGVVVHDGIVGSLKRFKEDAKEVSTGFECGIGLERFNDIKIGDILETYKLVEAKRVLQ